jgi:hypothetical protein
MGNSTYALVFVLLVNVLLVMTSLGIYATASSEGEVASACFSPSNSILNALGVSDVDSYNSISFNNNASNYIPNQVTGVTISNIGFTDVFNAVTGWVKTVGSFLLMVSGLGMFYSIFTACLHIPTFFGVLISALWFGISIFVIFSYVKGGGD